MLIRIQSWHLTDHCCRFCCGRILSQRKNKNLSKFICAKCETLIEAPSVISLCWCGVEAGNYGKIFECIVNPNKTSSSPNHVLVRERKVVIKPPEVKINRHIITKDDFGIED